MTLIRFGFGKCGIWFSAHDQMAAATDEILSDNACVASSPDNTLAARTQAKTSK